MNLTAFGLGMLRQFAKLNAIMRLESRQFRRQVSLSIGRESKEHRFIHVNQIKYIGKLRHNITDLSSEYLQLALKDEEVGQLLLRQNHYRHAVYYFVQSMEKFTRHKIFSLVNPMTEYFQNRTRTHNLDELLDFLIEIVSSDPIVKVQVKNQINTYVLGNIRFGKLHNDLRYPIFFEKYSSYSMLDIEKTDAVEVLELLQRLKSFIRGIDKLQRN